MKAFVQALTIALVPLFSMQAENKAAIGSPAPQFSVADQNGKTHSLSDYKGKFVVLEWFNAECPFVKKHYSSGNMQRLQEKFTTDGAAWLTINSSAEGKQGHLTASDAQKLISTMGLKSNALLLDTNGQTGKLYGAKVTPHMFLIDPEGKLLYAGAIDDKPSTDAADISTSKNLLFAAYTEAKAKKSVSVASTDPYGCSIKYAS